MAETKFEMELGALINRHSIENESDTPDWILAQFLRGVLDSWNQAVINRDDAKRGGPFENVIRGAPTEETATNG